MNRVQRQPGLSQPLLQIRDSGRVVVIEMRARRKHFDRLEPVRGNLEQMIAREPPAMIQVRRHPELTFGHRLEP